MKTSTRVLLSTAVLACAGALVPAHAQDALRIGLIATYSGPYADYGRQFDAGIALYLKEHGGKIAGRPVEIVKKDTGGPAPDAAKRIAQELVVRDKVNVLTGLDFSPNAYAVGAIATQAKVPTIVMNAASSAITTSSPYIARLSFTVQQVTDPMARYMLKQGVKEAYTVVADYASGQDAETAFKKAFTAGGGKVVGEVRTPMNNPDFSAYVQRIKDSKPQAVFFFFPSGVMPPSFLKVWKERGMEEAGIKLFATGEATDDSFLEATGDVALGLVTSHHYSYAHPSAKNQKFVKDFEAQFGTAMRPNYFAVTAYDALAAIDLALAKTKGDAAGDKLMAALKGLAFESPRGPVEIDAATRDIVQTVYIRKTEKSGGKLVNVEFDKFDRVKDPAKEGS
ncbi:MULTISPECIES: ABC transporter substrate-binding protein [unclassified Variovorax]|uniref:ABC transporter substrate-binding protein n=1 Tax=unclassified Variovorax TaxID=663243 RepID=UPI00076D4388|nr:MULTISPECIES: ABC transporter substrate-binding protein [unclassified Variovorax]KWT98842.1 ABC transporter substrate-binding protein [Variovorax sp. WDL1]PNG56096.1 Aliphatic amidase expression-regulating protein [Variovorax sp. B4]PNG57520.1 Aliphatic amidase expression-regulating protein [Variovorax sp. B2]VTV10086.1 Leucine-, isoleucine-, valine-, threonine-, and alanine-binding protein precursor [Variovorax sp. WDL1]